MNRKEFAELQQQFYDVYCGILFGSRVWQKGEDTATVCRFDCPEFAELRSRYSLERIAGGGGDFRRALRLCRYFAPRLRHESMYDNHVPCNALALLDYCFERKDVGINCVNKAKILAECCLALGIPARRVWMYPASPYDMDNHVVTEIYDRKRGGWLALDPTEGAYFTGEEGEPLSLPAVRRRMAMRERVTAVLPRQSAKDISALAVRNIANGTNPYYAKNMAFFAVELDSAFGEGGKAAFLVPQGFDFRAWRLQNIRFRMRWAKEAGMPEQLRALEAWYARAEKESPPQLLSEEGYLAPPNTEQGRG